MDERVKCPDCCKDLHKHLETKNLIHYHCFTCKAGKPFDIKRNKFLTKKEIQDLVYNIFGGDHEEKD